MTKRLKIFKIPLGGLLHDIGKFMQRAGLEKKYPEIKNNFDEFCPPLLLIFMGLILHIL